MFTYRFQSTPSARLSDTDEERKLTKLHLDVSLQKMEKQNISRVTGICVFLEDALGVR